MWFKDRKSAFREKKSTRDNNIQFSQLHATSVGNINQNPLSKTWITTTFYQISQLSQLTQTKLTNINKNSLTIHPKSLSHSQNKQTLKTQSWPTQKNLPNLKIQWVAKLRCDMTGKTHVTSHQSWSHPQKELPLIKFIRIHSKLNSQISVIFLYLVGCLNDPFEQWDGRVSS